jgi:hypothetical protein
MLRKRDENMSNTIITSAGPKYSTVATLSGVLLGTVVNRGVRHYTARVKGAPGFTDTTHTTLEAAAAYLEKHYA